jgi:hypothetical protein
VRPTVLMKDKVEARQLTEKEGKDMGMKEDY